MISNDYFNFIRKYLKDKHLPAPTFNEYVLTEPLYLDAEYNKRAHNYNTIIDFFRTSLQLFKESIYDEGSFALRKLLLNDSEDRLGVEFYKNLPECVWSAPLFFRTDASRSAKIYEIQCPGSGWGDVVLLEALYHHLGIGNDFRFNLPSLFVAGVQEVTASESPIVMHLLDNSSNPSMMRLFLQSTLAPIRYWGYSPNLRSADCQLIRSHSVYGLISENLFFDRLKQAELGKVWFDTPPLVIFDQKMILTLPFLEETQEYFTDEIRSILAYSTVLTNNGFKDVDGCWVDIKDFLSRPPRLRKYFLKYGGCDTSINWGSRGVYRLDTNNAEKLLKKAVDDFSLNRPWIIQPDLSEKEVVQYYNNEVNQPQESNLTAKYSSFYGPQGLLAVRTHHRRSTKVHGQPDSVAGLAYPSQKF